MTLVVDASVAIKWVVEEAGSLEAERLVRSEMLIAPDFLLLECANVLAQHQRRGRLTPDQASARLGLIARAGVRLHATSDLVAEAHRLAGALRQTAYDSLYLALALAETIPLVTADAHFADAAQPA